MKQILPICDHARANDPESIFFLTYSDVQRARQVLLVTGDGAAGLELFQFLDSDAQPCTNLSFKDKEFYRGGFYHIGIFVSDVERLCEDIVASGGQRLGPTMCVYGKYKAIYTNDPWGNVIELVDFTFSELADIQSSK